ncbi:MAG TPA: 4Fe-4S dicluster domain-containing protein [Burkholderiales bacterium]|nr:4Fe-4S dicluster domain-containing protein [Burkholderiales bacterium]
MFGALREGAPLAFDAGRCLRLRSRYSACEACARACPAGVLCVSDTAVTLAQEGCLHCGRCAAACPAGALQVEGFPRSEAALEARAGLPLYLDCWKVPASCSPAGALRVPCLAGLGLHEILRLHAEGRALVALDRGWCARCRAGCGQEHAALETIESARALLEALGVPERALPRLERQPLLPERMARGPIEALAERRLSRRDFVASLLREGIQAAAPPLPQPVSPPPRPGLFSDAPRAQLTALARAIAARHGREAPAELYPELRVSSGCRNHQVCAAICPSGALTGYETGDGTAGLVFDAAACIACGECARACPEGALTVLPHRAAGAAPAAPETLTRWGVRECDECGREFAAHGEQTLCLSCCKTRDLARQGFHQLFGAARAEGRSARGGERRTEHVNGEERA